MAVSTSVGRSVVDNNRVYSINMPFGVHGLK